MNDIRQEKLIKILIENPEKSLEKAMIEANYSPSYAHNHNIKNSESFIIKLDEAIKDDGIVATMKAILNRRTYTRQEFGIDIEDKEILDIIEKQGGEFPRIKVIVKKEKQRVGEGKASKLIDIEFEVKEARYYIPDESAVDKILDKLFKIKGHYSPEKHQNLNVNVDIATLIHDLQKNDTTYKPDRANNSASGFNF